MGVSKGGGKLGSRFYRQVEFRKSGLRLQRESKNHFNYLVPIRLAALTLSLQITTAKLSSRADETRKMLAKYIIPG